MILSSPVSALALAASSHKVGTDGGYLVYEHQSLGRVAFARQPIHSVLIQCSVGSLTKRTLPKRHSLSLGRAGSMTRPQLSAENHKPSTAARCADRALPKHCGQSLKTKTPGTQSLVPGVLFKSLALNIL